MDPDRNDFTDELIAGRRAGPPTRMPDDMPPWMAVLVFRIDTASRIAGRVFCWLLVPLMGAMVYEVVARKLFVAPTMWAYDISRMLCGAMFMLGAGYALSKGVHIRADFLYRNWPPRRQGMVDATLYVVFYFPALIFFTWVSYEYAADAWMRGERSMDTAWMAPLAPLRTAMPVGALLLLVQGVSELLKSIHAIRTNRWPQ